MKSSRSFARQLRAGLFVAGWWAVLPFAFALQVRSYDPLKHDRFSNFPSGSTATNGGFIHGALDLTGVGWQSNFGGRTLTMVSPRHFVGANHYKVPDGRSIRFLAADGVLRTYPIAHTESILNEAGEPTDLYLGTLVADLPASAGIGFQPYLNLPSEAAYANQALIVLGKDAQGGRNTIGAFSDFGGSSPLGGGSINTTRVFNFFYSEAGGGADDAHAEAGDSGSPSLVAVNGVAALVGVHTATLTAEPNPPFQLFGSTTTFDTFVPHYIDGLNALMADEGYHLTAASPPATTLKVTQQPNVGKVRAGYPFTIQIAVENEGGADANNLKLVNFCPAGTEVASASGANWVTATSPEGHVDARRGGLGRGTTTQYDLTLTINQPGTVQNEVELSADGSAGSSDTLSLTVIESFRSWSTGLSVTAPGSDDDRDNIELLLEYGFGGDPTTSSAHFPGTTIPLLPELSSGAPLELGYIVRRDGADRQLTYRVESSHDLATGSWLDAAPLIVSTTVSPLPGEFDRVVVRLDAGLAPRCFFRVRVELGE